jgi:hypothetical protein
MWCPHGVTQLLNVAKIEALPGSSPRADSTCSYCGSRLGFGWRSAWPQCCPYSRKFRSPSLGQAAGLLLLLAGRRQARQRG